MRDTFFGIAHFPTGFEIIARSVKQMYRAEFWQVELSKRQILDYSKMLPARLKTERLIAENHMLAKWYSNSHWVYQSFGPDFCEQQQQLLRLRSSL